MKALFLDDERWRHDLFEERMRGQYVVHHAYTLNQFKALISAHVFELVSFDFDLVEPPVSTSEGGAIISMGTPEYCGLDCVELLIASPRERWPARVVVHSWNSRGAGAMVSRLREAGFEPVREQFESKQTRLSREAEERFRARHEKAAAHGTIDEDEEVHDLGKGTE